MGLDNFKTDDLSDEERRRRDILSMNCPPDQSNKWRNYEPGYPSWVPHVNGKIEGESLVVMTNEKPDSMVKSDVFIPLQKCR